MQDSAKKKFKKASRRFKRLLVTTPIEMAVGLAVFGSVGGIASYDHEDGKRGEIPLAYSQTYQHETGKLNPLTTFYSTSSDAAMIVFEANNDAYARGFSNQTFAAALREDIQPADGKHAALEVYAQKMPQITSDALNSVKVLQESAELGPVVNAFNSAWSESDIDTTHQQANTTTSCDSKGNCTTTTTYTTVYDYTTHFYNYNSEQGALAARLLDQFINKHPDLTIDQALALIKSTSGGNKEVMRESRARSLDGKTPTDQQYLDWANTWATASRFARFEPGIKSNYQSLKSLATAWDAALQTAHSESYITYTHFDSGPAEYQLADQTGHLSATINHDASVIVDGIRSGGNTVPELTNKIHSYIDTVLNGAPGNADKMRNEIMDMARDLYKASTKDGFDVHPFKVSHIVLFTLLGAGLGFGAGFGVDRLLDLKKDKWLAETDEDKSPVSLRKNKNKHLVLT